MSNAEYFLGDFQLPHQLASYCIIILLLLLNHFTVQLRHSKYTNKQK